MSGKAFSATSVVTSRVRPLVLRTNSGLPIQRAHQLAHRSRCHVQLLRRQRKTLVPGTGFKGTQGVEVGY